MDIVRLLNTKTITKQEATRLLNNYSVIKELIDFYQIPLSRDMIQKQIALFDQHSFNIDILLMVKKWLEYYRVELDDRLLPFENIQLIQLEEQLNLLQQKITFEKEDTNILLFFLKNKSALFDAITHDLVGKLQKQAPTVSDMKNVLQAAQQFLGRLVDAEKLTLQDLYRVLELTKLEDDLTAELKVV